jgi:hypothetical protein
MFLNWLRNRRRGTGRSAGRRAATRRRPSCRPAIETLEDRWLPSTLTVLNTADSGPNSLRAEIAAAKSGDTIKFAPSLAGQTITLASELSIAKNLDIEGPGAAKLTVSGNDASRVFDIQAGATVTIAGLTIADGRVLDDLGGGVANEAGATLFLVNDTFADNTAFGVGGGLFNSTNGTVSVIGSTFIDNRAFGSLTFAQPSEGFILGGGGTEGGAIENDGVAAISSSTFADNLAQAVTGSDGTGGVAKAGGVSTNGALTITACVFVDNTAHAGDGAAGGSGGQGAGGAVNSDVQT